MIPFECSKHVITCRSKKKKKDNVPFSISIYKLATPLVHHTYIAMDCWTGHLVSAHSEEEQEYECVIVRPRRRPDPPTSKLSDMAILDSVYTEFLRTNSHDYRELKKICLCEKLTMKSYAEYYHETIPYLAKLFRRGGPTKVEVHVTLCNNGFVRFPKPGDNLKRDKFGTWISCDDCLRYMPGIAASFRHAGYDHYVAFYSYEEQRLDINAFNDGDPVLPNLVLTYKSRYPYEDNTVIPTPL